MGPFCHDQRRLTPLNRLHDLRAWSDRSIDVDEELDFGIIQMIMERRANH
ncbi:MAG: hypothetical protein KUL88_06645 [Rhizobium sp.]|nr:hypothetical protein [Rhizobium sp.]